MEKFIKSNLFFIVIGIIAVISIYFLVFSGTGIQNNGNTANDLRHELDNSAEQVGHSITIITGVEDRLTTAEGIVGNIETRNNEVTTRIERGQELVDRIEARDDKIESLVADSRDKLNECEQILGEVKQGAQRRSGEPTTSEKHS